MSYSSNYYKGIFQKDLCGVKGYTSNLVLEMIKEEKSK